MTKALAKLAIKHGIRVNAVSPGPVWTPFIPGSMPADKFKNFGGDTLFERPAQPIKLAPLYVWLVSAKACYVTCLVVEICFDRGDFAELRKFFAVGQHQLDLDIVLVRSGLILEIPGFGDVEVNPHDAFVR